MSVAMEHDDDDEPLSKVVESQNETETVLIEEGVKSELIENVGISSEPRKRKLPALEDTTGSTAIAYLDQEIINVIHLLLPRISDSIQSDLSGVPKEAFTQHYNTLKQINDKLQILREKMKTIRSPKVMKLMNTQQVVRKGAPQLVRKVLPPGQIQQVMRLAPKQGRIIQGNKIMIPAGGQMVSNGNGIAKLISAQSAQSKKLMSKPIIVNANSINEAQRGVVGGVQVPSPKFITVPANPTAPRFAKVMIKDANGKQRIVTMPIDQVRKLQKPKQPVQTRQQPAPKPVQIPKPVEEKDNFFLGNEDDDSNVKIEVIEAESETATIEEIDENEKPPDEPADIVETAEIKEEPQEPNVGTIGEDGIDHSALEGMVNLCDSREQYDQNDENEEPLSEDKIKEKWTDEMIQAEIEKVGRLADVSKPQCAICRRSFTSIAYLKSHMRAHKMPLRCKVCYMEFRMASKLKNHELLHIYETPQTCSMPNCGLIFKTVEECRTHEETHSHRFKCEICGKQLASEKSKNEHKVTFHLGGSEFMCDTCGKAFSNKSTLNRHRLLHQTEKPYPCTLCKRAFIDQKTLKNHQKTCSKHFFSVIGD